MVVNEGYRMKPAVYEDEEGNEYEDYSAFIEKDVDEAKIERLGIKRRLEAVSAPSGAQLPCLQAEEILGAFCNHLVCCLENALFFSLAGWI